jgi:hypothetical protein
MIDIEKIVVERFEGFEQRVKRLVVGVLSGFDFKKVWRCMVMLDLGWLIDGVYRIPDIDEMVDSCVRLIIMALGDLGKSRTFGSGGFCIEYDHIDFSLDLQFCIEYSYNCLD